PQSRIRNTVTLDDRHVMAKHASIYPREEELRSVHQIVTIAERSLKALSAEELEEEKEEEEEGGEKKADLRPRVLSAVNRVGPLAKGLLIHNDDTVDLVLLCGDIPNKDLLHRVMENLPEQIRKIDDTIKFELIEEEAGFKIVADFDVKVELSVTLTSTEITLKKELKPKEVETPASDESHDEISGNLPKHLLLGALARLRHAKWFQARASQQDSCVVITRILRDLQKRDKVWGALSSWALENLVYIALSSSTEHMSPGDAFRRFFEVVSGGILLPDRPGLQDPCEKEPIDILDCCTDQQLDDVTKSAQNFLLKIAFREVHKVLGMDRVNSMHRHPNS
uniref:DZF domain-containing protein n=1 Tax=Ciona intestinalis TaxID=7719 RepID=H2XPQ6_CIOIN